MWAVWLLYNNNSAVYRACGQCGYCIIITQQCTGHVSSMVTSFLCTTYISCTYIVKRYLSNGTVSSLLGNIFDALMDYVEKFANLDIVHNKTIICCMKSKIKITDDLNCLHGRLLPGRSAVSDSHSVEEGSTGIYTYLESLLIPLHEGLLEHGYGHYITHSLPPPPPPPPWQWW